MSRSTRRWIVWSAIALITLFLTINLSIQFDTTPQRTLPIATPSALVWAQETSGEAPSAAESNAREEIEAAIDGFAVMLAGEELFVIQESVGSFSAEDRAEVMSTRIREIAADPSISLDNFQIETQEQSTNLVLDNRVVVTITDADAQSARQPGRELAQEYKTLIQTAVQQYREERSQDHLIRGGIYTLVSAIALLIIFTVLNRLFPWIYRKVEGWQTTIIRPLRIQNLELVSRERMMGLLIGMIKLIRLVLTLVILYVFIPLILSFFPWTRRLGYMIFTQILDALETVGQSLLNYLPNIFTVAVVAVLAFYTIRFIQPIFTEIERGSLPIPGFYPEWADPTFNLVKILIIALALIVAVPYLPGADSPAFQGVSLFLGVLFSLGSTSAVANVVSGVILIYTRAFQVGDRVKIADAVGDVEEKTLLVTRIRTPKNVLITIPNAAVLGGNVINFSASVRESHTPLIVHTAITLGYDVPWRKVYQVLKDAAAATDHILRDPTPFVLQTSLDDFYVSYELNVYTHESGSIPQIYSQLHEHLQDKCNEADIEILSPHYSAVRDGNQITIPADYLPKNYTPPAFRINPIAKVLNLDTPSSPPSASQAEDR